MKEEDMNELEFVEKPIRKPDHRVYGRLETWKDSDFQQFVPVAKGTGSKREVVRSSGKAKLVKNEGKTDSSYSLLINADAKNEQFAETMMDDAMKVLKPYIKKEVKLPTARFVVDKEDLKIWRSKERNKICIHVEMDGDYGATMIPQAWAQLSCDIVKHLMQSNITKK